MSKKIATGAILDRETIKKLKKLKATPKYCEYCGGEYYPHRNTTPEQWEKQRYCKSICKANANLKPFKKTLTN